VRSGSACFLAGVVLAFGGGRVSAVEPCPGGGDIFLVDPVAGVDEGNTGQPFKTVAYLIKKATNLGPGDTIRLRAVGLHPPATFPATLQGPLCVEPYDTDAVEAGPTAVFDGGIKALRTAPNTEWERVWEGHRDEWRTRESHENPSGVGAYRYGQMMASKLRLLTYARVEDLRSDNESLLEVPLSDPRAGLDHLVGRETHRYPWTYFGPGIHWIQDPPDPGDPRPKGRIHIRLSHTHLNAPGITDYTGPTNPNEVALSIAPEDRQGVIVNARQMTFKNITFQNGGAASLTVGGQDITFDHCQVYGSRYGVRMGGGSANLTFRHCMFDGALAPWTTRNEVKTEYAYYDPYPPAPEQAPRKHRPANLTNDILVINAADHVEYDHCTFRRSHDAIQVRGRDVSIHHSLFEDINDEAVQFDKTACTRDVHVYENVLRQVLSPLSFALDDPAPDAACQLLGGPFYIYRNVVDQRVPTRGLRVLPPDAPAPFLWRYGNDFKMNGTVPPFHVYQNTFLSSHPNDKGHALSLVFSDSPPAPAPARTFLNNIHVGLNVDLPLSHVFPGDATRSSQGNIWHQFHGGPPRFCRTVGPSTPCTLDLEQLAVLDPDWEKDSQFVDPGLANLDDEYFDHQVPYPNNDFRPSAATALGRGVVLPADLPDTRRPAGGVRPDVGALDADATPVAVGVGGATLIPEPGVPIARGGADQLLLDADGDGFETVAIDGSRSTDADGTLVAYAWTESDAVLTPQATDVLYLPEGEHYLRLKVTDDDGKVDTDGVRVHIPPPAPHGDNLIACPGFEESLAWRGPCGWHIEGAVPVELPHTGRLAVGLTASQKPVVRQRVAVSPGAAYVVSAWSLRNEKFLSPAKVRVVFRDPREIVLQTTDVTFVPSTEYRYGQALVVAPAGAIATELLLGVNLQTGSAFFDDVRVFDRNLLVNGRFETPAPNGSEERSPGWRIDPGHGAIVKEVDQVRSGRLALAIEGGQDARWAQQLVPLTGGGRYRVSGWIMTKGLSGPAAIQIKFSNSGEHDLAATSEGEYTFVSEEFDFPGATSLTVKPFLGRGVTGTAYFDDLLVEPLN
jgi:hypothetical protein